MPSLIAVKFYHRASLHTVKNTLSGKFSELSGFLAANGYALTEQVMKDGKILRRHPDAARLKRFLADVAENGQNYVVFSTARPAPARSLNFVPVPKVLLAHTVIIRKDRQVTAQPRKGMWPGNVGRLRVEYTIPGHENGKRTTIKRRLLLKGYGRRNARAQISNAGLKP